MKTTPMFDACVTKNRTPKFYSFHAFADPGCPISFTGPFRYNVRRLVEECAELEYEVNGMPVWCTFLVHESRGIVVPLYTIEEEVKHSADPFCNHCRCAGWSNHFVSKRKYHFIIPEDEEWKKPMDDFDFHLQTHLLHGLIHCNGFGHLLCLNGIEGGSKHLYGREIMDLWDRICTALHTWKISVEDYSKKHKMDLRLLYGVAYGHSWFGRWGYQFSHGSFGVKEHNYERAIETISSLKLDQLIADCSQTNGCRKIEQIINHYKDLSVANLVTLTDLFRFMLAVKMGAPLRRKPVPEVTLTLSSSRYFIKGATKTKYFVKEKSAKCRKFSNVAATMDSRWPVRRLQLVADVIVEALKQKRAENTINKRGMTRQEVRDAARLHIGDTGLIDHVLKAMNNVIVGNYIVRRSTSRVTRVLEYSLEDVPSALRVKTEKVPEQIQLPNLSPGENVYKDVAFLYNNILLRYPGSSLVNLAVQTILDSKHFVKEWPFRDEADDLLRFICKLTPTSDSVETELFRGFQPVEYVIVPPHATVGDLKLAIQESVRDTYCIMENIWVTDIVEMEGIGDTEVLFGVIESGADLLVRGHGVDFETELRYEGGTDNWTVRCKCGATDDDGERMVSCDICEIWQHTRCIGIKDAAEVPPLFVCDSCCTTVVPSEEERGFEIEYYEEPLLPHLSGADLGLMYCE